MRICERNERKLMHCLSVTVDCACVNVSIAYCCNDCRIFRPKAIEEHVVTGVTHCWLEVMMYISDSCRPICCNRSVIFLSTKLVSYIESGGPECILSSCIHMLSML